MSLATETKSKGQKSKYTINLSFDLPLRNSRLLVNQPIRGELIITPSPEGKRMKINLNSARTTLQLERKNTTTKADSINNRSSRDQKSSFHKVINKSHYTSSVNNKIFVPSHTRSLSYGAKGRNNNSKQISTRIIGELDDDIIGYTYPSSELQSIGDRRVEKPKRGKSPLTTPLLKNYESTSLQDLNIIKQIRNFQNHADDKLRQFHLEHIRQNFLMKNSARIIQRAWRKYQTSKIVSGYSTLTRRPSGLLKNADLFKQKRVLNVKSCGFKNGKSELKKSIKESKQFFIEDVCSEGPVLKQEISDKKKMQMEEIQKWESLIRDLRKSKDIHQVFEKAQFYKQRASENLNSNADKSKLVRAIQKIENSDMSQETNTKNKESKAGPKKQEDSQKGPFSPTSSTFETPKNKPHSMQPNPVQVEEAGQENKQKGEQNKSEQKQISYFSESSQVKNEDHRQESTVANGKQQKALEYQTIKKASNQLMLQIDKLSSQVFMDLVMEALLEMELTFQFSHTWIAFTSGKLPNLPKPIESEKWQGICTNMESIKDYLESLISYMLEQCPEALVSGFNLPLGPTSMQLLSCFRNSQKSSLIDFTCNKQLIAKEMFREHWAYASKQIYFQNKFKDQEKETERINRLKDITKVYFELVFDSFNECLSPFRIFGLQGAPCSWEYRLAQNKIDDINVAKQLVKQGFRSLSQLAVIFCGLLTEDKQPKIPKDVVQEIRQQRMSIFLESQLVATEWTWHLRSFERSEIKFEIGEYLMEEMFKQASDELRFFFR